MTSRDLTSLLAYSHSYTPIQIYPVLYIYILFIFCLFYFLFHCLIHDHDHVCMTISILTPFLRYTGSQTQHILPILFVYL